LTDQKLATELKRLNARIAALVPGDSKEYREYAKRCLQIAQETTNPALRASLEEIAHHWLRFAADLEATKPLLEAWGDPCLFRQRGSEAVDIGARSPGGRMEFSERTAY
jgi:hypothetical protein